MTEGKEPRRSRLGSWLRGLLLPLLFALTFVVSLLGSLLLHSNLPLLRRAAADAGNLLLRDVFYGKLVVGTPTRLSFRQLELRRVTVSDEQGAEIIQLANVRIELSAWTNVARLFSRQPKLTIALPHARIESAHVQFLADPATREPTLVRALTPRPSKPRPSARGKEPGEIRVFFPILELGRVTAEASAFSDLVPTLTNVQSQLLVTSNGVALDVHRFGAKVEGVLDHDLVGTGSLKLRAPGVTHLSFVGFLGDVELQLAGTIEESRVEVEAFSQAASPSGMKQLLPAWPFREPVSARVRAKGDLPDLDLEGTFGTESSSVQVDGRAALGERPHGRFAVRLREIDVQSFEPRAPPTRVNAEGDVSFVTTDSESHPVALSVSAKTEPTTIAGNEVPALDLGVTYRDGKLTGTLELDEPGMPVSADVRLDGEHVAADVRVPRFALEGSRRIPKGPRGLLSLDAKLTLDDELLRVEASGRVDHFRLGDFSAARIDVRGQGNAPKEKLDEPRFELGANLVQARYGTVHYGKVRLDLSGTPKRARAKAKLEDADGRALAVEGLVYRSGKVEDVRLRASRHGVVVRARVDHADPAVPSIEVSHLELQDGTAKLNGKVRYRPGLLEGELSAEDVKLARVAEAIGLGTRDVVGTLDSDSTFALGKDLSRAHLSLELRDFSVAGWGRARLELDATLRDRSLRGSLAGRDEPSGILTSATFDVVLGGHALEAESYETATGSLEFSLNNARLTGLDMLLESERFSEVDGLLGLRARLERDRPSGWPSALVELGAQELVARVRVGQDQRKVEGLASYTSVLFNAPEKRAFGSSMVADANGALVTVTGAMSFDPGAFMASARDAMHAFQEQPLNLVVGIPRRRLDAFPLVEANDVPDGAFSGQLTLFGTPSEPQISALLDLHDLAPRDDHSRPVSVKVQATYAPTRGDLESTVQGTLSGRNVVMGKASGVVPVSALLGVARWNAEAKLVFDRFPLAVIPPLAAIELDGAATGALELSRERELDLAASLDLDQVRVGRAELGNGSLALKGSPGEALLNFTLADRGRVLNVKALALGRDPAQLPLPHQLESIGIQVRGRRVNAALLGPALRDVVARLEGDLDLDLTWFLERQEDPESDFDSRLEGTANLSRGNAYVDALGLELHDIEAKLAAKPAAERTVIDLVHLGAKARTKTTNFEGRGQLFMEGAKVIAGSADLWLRTVPITLEGLSLGKASGRALLTMERGQGWNVAGPHEGKEYLVMNLNLAHWDMKASRSVSRRLIDLSKNDEIVVLQAKSQTAQRSDLTPIRVFITLEPGAKFGYGDISLPLSGEAQADFDGQTRVMGEIRLQPGSRLPLLGKRFDVLAGTIRLDPKELGNPELDIALSGTSPEGDVVNLSVTGTLKEPELDPPPSELQALLGGGTATILGGGVQALGFNELLGESVGAVELRVKAGEQEEDDPSYAAAIQIGPNLWFEGGYRRARDSGLNQNQGDVFSGSIDYRFRENWSLETRLGNAGGGVDVLWQHRY